MASFLSSFWLIRYVQHRRLRVRYTDPHRTSTKRGGVDIIHIRNLMKIGTQEARGKGKIALVTGISGMLGSHVAEALLDRGYEVHGVVRPRSNLRNVAAFQSRAKMIIAELTDPWRVFRLVQKLKPDFIFHFAAQAFNSLSFEQPAETLHTNLMSAFGFF